MIFACRWRRRFRRVSPAINRARRDTMKPPIPLRHRRRRAILPISAIGILVSLLELMTASMKSIARIAISVILQSWRSPRRHRLFRRYEHAQARARACGMPRRYGHAAAAASARCAFQAEARARYRFDTKRVEMALIAMHTHTATPRRAALPS